MEFLTNFIYKDINDRYGLANYLDHEIIIMKENNYINMTKLCDKYNKRFRKWKENKSS